MMNAKGATETPDEWTTLHLKNDWTSKQRTTRQGYEDMSEENGLSNQVIHGGESILVTSHEGIKDKS